MASITESFRSLGASFSDPTITSKDIQRSAEKLYAALQRAAKPGTGRRLPSQFEGNWNGVAAACAAISHQQFVPRTRALTHTIRHGSSAGLDWQKQSNISQTAFKKALKELGQKFDPEIRSTFSRSNAPPSSGNTPRSTPDKRKAPSSASRTSSNKRARIERKSAADRDAELAEVTPTKSTGRRSAAAEVTPASTPTRAKGKGRQVVIEEDDLAPEAILDLVLPPRIVTGELDPHDYELDQAYGREERRKLTEDWRTATLERLRERI